MGFTTTLSLISDSTFRIFQPAIFLAIAFLLCAFGAVLLLSVLNKKYTRATYWISVAVVAVVSATVAWRIPLSPVNDSYSMALGL